MFTARHWTECRILDGCVGEGPEVVEGGLQPHGGSNSVNWPDPQSSRGLDYKPKDTHGGAHGSSHICGIGWPCWTSVGGAALGPEGVLSFSVGECQSGKVGVGRWESTLIETWGAGMG